MHTQEAAVMESTTKTQEIIEAKYPEKIGFIRRITHLWDSFFRITYINQDTGNIPESYFIQVNDGVIESEKLDG